MNSQSLRCENGQSIDVGLDHIWIGRSESFPQTVGRYMPIRFSTTQGRKDGIDLGSDYTVDDYTGRLSDHNSPGNGIKVLDIGR